MDTTGLRSAYDRLLDAAAHPDLGDADDGGWDADQVLAHVLSVDAGIAAVALGVASGSRPTFDNRMSLDPWNLRRIIGEHRGRPDLIRHVRDQGAVLCDVADQLSDEATSVLVPSLLLSNGAVLVDQPVPLAGLVDGLAGDHLPRHTQQLLDLRVAVPGRPAG
ncbi:hypothetical protein [Geodermatophilus sp. DSM 45219]|uniref:hypothetical protein n=1 Tax=Geodermatophilus sp. DSM 45219 TaxID=1881103 RepID=UPI00089022DE|nr:hypothetical protein [Geodermatophilus sp. DSM 45219]SDN93437.1 hypothetical protein SAMN05428965_1986 [Geodermatophilus sp. DSM 45219]